MKKTIITAATTGAWPKKKDNPNVPMTPSEIADDIFRCWKAGAAIAHLHMRDDSGDGTMDAAKFRETVELLRQRYPECDIILNMTTSGDLNATDETRQLHVKELRPEMCSYDCGSMNWLHTGLFLNTPKFLEELGKNTQEWGVKPEIEAFDPGMIANAAYYLKKGVLKGPLHFQFCMGCANGIPGTVKNLVFMKETMDSAPVLHGAALAWDIRLWRFCMRRWLWAGTSAWAWRIMCSTPRAFWRRATRSLWSGPCG